MNGEGQEAQNLAADRPHRRGPHEDVTLGIDDELDEAFVPHGVEPAPSGVLDRLVADGDVEASVTGLGLGEADARRSRDR